ncbi:MAG: RNA polymerase sigma factor [Pirellulales bacterium]
MEDLGRRLANGEESAFAELYDACADRLFHYLVLRLGSRTDAEDVLQETFLRLARSRDSLATVRNLMAYLFQIARHEAIRIRQRKQGEAALHSLTGLEELSKVEGDSGLQFVENAEWAKMALLKLESDVREVIELKVYGMLTLAEVSEVLQIPLGTAATRYRRGLEILRSLLTKEQI